MITERIQLRGYCKVCGKNVAVRQGRMVRHSPDTVYFTGLCKGIGTESLEPLSTHKVMSISRNAATLQIAKGDQRVRDGAVLTCVNYFNRRVDYVYENAENLTKYGEMSASVWKKLQLNG